MPIKFDIKRYAKALGIELTEDKISDIDIYIREINAWNSKAGLTSLNGDENIFVNLFLDAFTLIPYIKEGGRIADVGTGAGFPGLAIKLFFRDLKVTLIDSASKKCVFLNHISNLLNFKDVDVVWERAEEIGRDVSYREKFDYVCCRAVSGMNAISELCIPLLKIGGTLVASRGKDVDEINEAEATIKILGGNIERIDKIKYPFFNEEKNIVIVSKVQPTPEKYPRRNGIPQKRPIKTV